MTERRPLSPMKRLALFERDKGRCHLCAQRIHVGQLWEVEHRIPLALGGKDDELNMAPMSIGDVRPIQCREVGERSSRSTWMGGFRCDE